MTNLNYTETLNFSWTLFFFFFNDTFTFYTKQIISKQETFHAKQKVPTASFHTKNFT